MSISGREIEEARKQTEKWFKTASREELLEFQKKFDPNASLRHKHPQRPNGKHHKKSKSAGA